jgi:heme/copper-type cytochrome/quinol oxidase subunit 3
VIASPASPQVLPQSRSLQAKAGFYLFLAVDLMFFLGLISSWVALRLGAPQWPSLGQALPDKITGAFLSLLLGAAAFQMPWLLKKAGSAQAPGLLALPALLGSAFLFFEILEWQRLWNLGLQPGYSAQAGIFYALCGAHAVQLGAALLALLWLGLKLKKGSAAQLSGELVGHFWIFTASIWVLIYASVYLG